MVGIKCPDAAGIWPVELVFWRLGLLAFAAKSNHPSPSLTSYGAAAFASNSTEASGEARTCSVNRSGRA